MQLATADESGGMHRVPTPYAIRQPLTDCTQYNTIGSSYNRV